MKWYEVMLLSLGWYKGGLTVKPGGKTLTHFYRYNTGICFRTLYEMNKQMATFKTLFTIFRKF